MKRLKVMTVLGTRPEIIRLSRVLVRLDEQTDHVVVHTGQNYDYELCEVFYRDLGLRKPDHFLAAAGANAAETIANVIARIDPILAGETPDALLVLGDTNSCLAALPAKRRRIPIFHMEAGNRCFDQRVPEEINRRIVDHLADVNLPYSAIAREYLLREGFPPDRVIVTGSPMREVLTHNGAAIEASDVHERLGLADRDYFVVSAHREENVDSDAMLDALAAALTDLAETQGHRIIVSTHPRTRKRLEARGIRLPPLVETLPPLGFLDYVHLEKEAIAVLSDSGTLAEEANLLDFPALNLREAHERPEGMEEAAVMMVGLNLERIRQGLAILAAQPRGEGRRLRTVRDWDVPVVSEKIVRILVSYTDYVHRTVWGRHVV